MTIDALDPPAPRYGPLMVSENDDRPVAPCIEPACDDPRAVASSGRGYSRCPRHRREAVMVDPGRPCVECDAPRFRAQSGQVYPTCREHYLARKRIDQKRARARRDPGRAFVVAALDDIAEHRAKQSRVMGSFIVDAVTAIAARRREETLAREAALTDAARTRERFAIAAAPVVRRVAAR